MIIEIEDLPPMPRNRSHMLTVAKKRPMNIKTPLCREFEKDLEQRLEKYKNDFESFKHMDDGSSFLSVVYYIYTPAGLLFTKDGRISSKATDLDSHKVFQDTIFRCLGLDDKLVREVTYVSPISHNDCWNYRIQLSWRKIECLKNMSTWIQSTIEPTNETSTWFALL